MLNTLFSPNGRLGADDFMKGMIALAVMIAIVVLSPLVDYGFSKTLKLFAFLLVIALFFMLIKRSRDGGKSGWMSVLWFILIIAVFFVINMVLSQFFPAPLKTEMAREMSEILNSRGSLEEIAMLDETYGEGVAKEGALPSAIASILGFPISAFLINKIVPSAE